MSKKNRKIFLTLLTLFLVTLCIFAAIQIRAFVSQIGVVKVKATSDPLHTKLDIMVSSYKDGEISVIDISAITTFSWDQLYIFTPYTTATYLDSTIGVSWRNTCSTQIETSDAYTLLVFTQNNTVVHCLDYSRGNDFYIPAQQGYEGGFSPQQALFVLDDLGRMVVKDK